MNPNATPENHLPVANCPSCSPLYLLMVKTFLVTVKMTKLSQKIFFFVFQDLIYRSNKLHMKICLFIKIFPIVFFFKCFGQKLPYTHFQSVRHC